MHKQGLGDALAAATDGSLHCTLKLILLGSECLIHVPGNDSGHEQQVSMCPHLGFYFHSYLPDFPPRSAVLVKGTV